MCQTNCDITSSNVLGRVVQCEKVGQGRWVGVHTKVKTAGLCVGLAVKALSPHCANVLENSYLTSRGLHAVFKYDLLA